MFQAKKHIKRLEARVSDLEDKYAGKTLNVELLVQMLELVTKGMRQVNADPHPDEVGCSFNQLYLVHIHESFNSIFPLNLNRPIAYSSSVTIVTYMYTSTVLPCLNVYIYKQITNLITL